jgi:two-component system nitrate/nitrite response regulator NarL
MSASQELVADYPGAFRSGVSSYLAEDAGYDVVEVDDADGLVAAEQAGTPGVILIDSCMARSADMQNALAALGVSTPSAIVWGFDVEADTVVAALRAGANGYLDKGISPAGLRRAIDAVLRGEAVLPRSILRSILDRLRSWDERSQAREVMATLSPREQQVLTLIGSGAQNRSIAASLHISEYTVKRHVQNILRKLDLPSRKAAAAMHRLAVEGEAGVCYHDGLTDFHIVNGRDSNPGLTPLSPAATAPPMRPGPADCEGGTEVPTLAIIEQGGAV